MQVQFWGAAREVTGSMHLLTVGDRRLLLDCGLFQGRRKGAFERNRNLPFDAASIDAVILSHAHIDHSGNLPTLYARGFRGPIYATAATADLCDYMMIDSASIQKNDVRYVNRKRKRQGKQPFEPLYGMDDARGALGSFHAVDYEKPFEPIPGVNARFIDAGHILGSASVILDLQERGVRRRLVFSGDIGRPGLPILRDPRIAPDTDLVIMESTYGDRDHPPASVARDYLRDCSRLTYDTGGKLLVPAFALGRTQEVVYGLNQLWEDEQLPPIDVYVDSPLALNVTEVYKRHPECYDRQMRDMVASDSDGDPLGFRRLKYIRSVDESKALNTLNGPAVIISASGMCEGGRILHHLRNNIGAPTTTVLFVGYQAQHTLGRRLLEGVSPVRIYGDEFDVEARIERADNYSAHAGRSALIEWAERTMDEGNPRRFFMVHGEEESALSLAEAIRGLGRVEVEVPERGQTFEL